jgi:hypothetical protein
MTHTKHKADRRASWPLTLVVGLCMTGFALMAALHVYAFVWKTAVVPLILLAALMSRRLDRFIDDWAVFFSAVIMFDFCRGFIFALTTHFSLPVHLGYVIDWERALCGGRILPAVLQSWRAGLAWAPAIDRTLTLLHSSHFAYFLLFGMAVWLLRPESFRRYVTAVLLLTYAGLCFYLILPTVPPWMAYTRFGAIPPMTHITWGIYNATIPSIQPVFDVNPIAAMPSLHAALPTLCTLIGLRLFGWRLWPMVVYTFMIYLAVTYLGEHYLVDVLAGGLLAAAVYVAVFRFDLGVRWGMRSQMIRPVLLSVLLITAAEGLGQATIALQYPRQEIDALEREIAVSADVVHYYRGRAAYDAGSFDVASREFAAALDAQRQPADQRDARMWLGRSAFRAGAYPTVIAALEPLREHAAPADILTLLAVAYLNDGRADQGMAILTDLTSRFPTEPEPLYWLTRFRYLQSKMKRSEVMEVVKRMGHLPDQNRAASFQRLLLRTLDADGGS